MVIKIPESIKIPNRTRNITLQSKGTGGSMDWSLHDGQLSGKPEDNPLFIFMLKYLMAPLQKNLNNVADNFRFYMRPKLLEDAAENNAGMEVDAEEYKQHMKYAWKELNEAIFYQPERKEEKGGKTPQSGILYILSQQAWIDQEAVEPLIRRTRHRMSRGGAKSQFADILDPEDEEGRTLDIGTVKQKKIFGYRTGEKATELWAAADRKKPYWPILKLLKQLDDTGSYTTDAGTKEKIIELEEIPTKTYGKGKSSQRVVVQIKSFRIHFDRLFKIFREENGMFPPTKQTEAKQKEIADMSADEYKTMIAGEEQQTLLDEAEKETMDIGKAKKEKTVRLGDKEERVLQEPNLADRQFLMTHGGFWEPKGMTSDDQMNLIKINLKILWNEAWPIDAVEIKTVDWLIIRLARYGIITLNRAQGILEDQDLRGLKEFDFTRAEYKLIEKALRDRTDLSEIEQELKTELDQYSRGKKLEEETEEKRSKSRPIIHGSPNTEWADRKLFPDIYRVPLPLKDIDLRGAANPVAEFREVLEDAVTPGREGIFTFSIGIDTKMESIAQDSFTLQAVGFEAVQTVPYRDYIAQSYSESGSSKFMPSGYQEPRSTKAPREKDYADKAKYQAAIDTYNKEIRGRTGREIEGGQVDWKGSSLSEPQIFLHYLKKQLTKLSRMVKANV